MEANGPELLLFAHAPSNETILFLRSYVEVAKPLRLVRFALADSYSKLCVTQR